MLKHIDQPRRPLLAASEKPKHQRKADKDRWSPSRFSNYIAVVIAPSASQRLEDEERCSQGTLHLQWHVNP